jgi:hypothetical protein
MVLHQVTAHQLTSLALTILTEHHHLLTPHHKSLAVGNTAAVGTGGAPAREDHVHEMPDFGNVAALKHHSVLVVQTEVLLI